MTNALTIELTGKIQNTNFDEWKRDLIVQIKSTNTELISDDDFYVAAKQVKMFKSAEKSLKKAKQSAIEQASDIQKLFLAIDEISEEARQTRLILERQIKSRKLEIKEELIQSGLERVEKIISNQCPDFQLIRHSEYLDKEPFLKAVKGKAGIKGIQKTIDELIESLEKKILLRAEVVSNNAKKLDSLAATHKVLFQDRMALLSLSEVEFELTIDKRIASFNEKIAKKKAQNAIDELNQKEESELNPGLSTDIENCEKEKRHRYKISMDIFSTKEEAIEIASSIREKFSGIDTIKNIKLSRSYEYLDL
jgi:hypothetical protein